MDDSSLVRALPKRHTRKSLENLLGKPRFAYDVESINRAINYPAWDLLSRGGKRWRVRLFDLLFKAFGGKRGAELSSLVEIVHNGTLMIDDIEDSSDLRRGKPCVHLIHGTDIAINAGNAMYYLPLKLVIGAKLPDKVKLAIFETYSIEMIRISHGQALDIWWHRSGRIPTEKQYLQMCAYKTGTLARMAAKIAGILCGLSERKRDSLGEFAESLGVAFQIQDDVLNLIGYEKKYGKEIGGDITEGKKTLAVIRALSKLQKEEQEELKAILSEHAKGRERVRRGIELIKKTGALEYCRKVSKDLVRTSWKKVEKIIPDCREKPELFGFASYLVNREV